MKYCLDICSTETKCCIKMSCVCIIDNYGKENVVTILRLLRLSATNHISEPTPSIKISITTIKDERENELNDKNFSIPRHRHIIFLVLLLKRSILFMQADCMTSRNWIFSVMSTRCIVYRVHSISTLWQMASWRCDGVIINRKISVYWPTFYFKYRNRAITTTKSN